MTEIPLKAAEDNLPRMGLLYSEPLPDIGDELNNGCIIGLGGGQQYSHYTSNLNQVDSAQVELNSRRENLLRDSIPSSLAFPEGHRASSYNKVGLAVPHGEVQRSPDGTIAQGSSTDGLEPSIIMMTPTGCPISQMRPVLQNSSQGHLFKGQGTSLTTMVSTGYPSSKMTCASHNSPTGHLLGQGSSKEGVSCEVCGKPASGHLYYGARSCHSCRAFFRRAMQGRKFSSFECKFFQKCQIDSKSWKSCQWCRFQQCLKAGMRDNLVRFEKKQKVLKVLNRCQQIATNVSLSHHFSNTLTPEEKDIITKSAFKVDSDWWLDLIRLHKQNPSCMDQFLQVSHLTEALTDVDKDPIIRLITKRTWRKRFMALGTENNVKLDPNDGEALVERASMLDSLLILLITTELSMPDYGAQDLVDEMFRVTGGGQDFALFLQFNKNWKRIAEKTSSYHDQFSSPWAVGHDVELRHHQLYRTLIDTFHNLSEDNILFLLLHDLFTYTPGDLVLSNPTAVQKMFQVKSSLLFRYLKEKCGEAAVERHAQLLHVHSILVELDIIAKTKTLIL